MNGLKGEIAGEASMADVRHVFTLRHGPPIDVAQQRRPSMLQSSLLG